MLVTNLSSRPVFPDQVAPSGPLKLPLGVTRHVVHGPSPAGARQVMRRGTYTVTGAGQTLKVELSEGGEARVEPGDAVLRVLGRE